VIGDPRGPAASRGGGGPPPLLRQPGRAQPLQEFAADLAAQGGALRLAAAGMMAWCAASTLAPLAAAPAADAQAARPQAARAAPDDASATGIAPRPPAP
jgi:hypothetical protein